MNSRLKISSFFIYGISLKKQRKVKEISQLPQNMYINKIYNNKKRFYTSIQF